MKITKTVTVSGRVEICSLASVARAYEKEGLLLRSKSDILWQAIEQLSLLYSKKHGIEPFADVREAAFYMKTIGLPLDTSTRTIRDIATAKVCQDAEEDYGLESLERMIERKSRVSSSPSSSLPKKKGDETETYRKLYTQAKERGFSGTFEEFLEGIEKVKTGIDQQAFSLKEEQRLQEEKTAYNADALRSALSTSTLSKGGGEEKNENS